MGPEVIGANVGGEVGIGMGPVDAAAGVVFTAALVLGAAALVTGVSCPRSVPIIGRILFLTVSSLLTRKCLSDLAWLRTAFLEDPLVEGMLAAKKAKGASVRAAVMQEKKNEAKADAERLGREEAVRTMLGPWGGLPTLKADLLKLAALLRVEIGDKDTARLTILSACCFQAAGLDTEGYGKGKDRK